MTTKQGFAEPGPGRCDDCRWIDERDTTAGKHYMGVGLCARHLRAERTAAALVGLVGAAKLAHAEGKTLLPADVIADLADAIKEAKEALK